MCGGDSAYPFCDINRGRLCLDWTPNTRTCKYIQFLVVSLYVSKKLFSCIFPAMSTRCIAAGCSKSTKDGVSLQIFSTALCSKHFEPSCFENPEYTTHFNMKKEKKSSFLKHDAIPTIFHLLEKSKKVPERRNENQVLFQLWGHVLACAKRHHLVLALHAIHHASIDVANSALSGRAYFQMCK